MTIVLCLNELSCGTDVERSVVDNAMVEFVDLLRAVWKWRGAASLFTGVRLSELELSVGYFMQQWINADPRNKVRWEFLRSLQGRTPFSDLFSEETEGLIEYSFMGRLAEGLGAADLVSGLAVSLAVHDIWNASDLKLDRLLIMEGESGDDEQVDEVYVHHAVRASQAEYHRTWLEGNELARVTSGRDIWDKRSGLFAHLSFLSRVEDDLRVLAPASVRFVAEKLTTIDSAVGDWRVSGSAIPAWLTSVNPEYEQREAYCEFEDLDGVIRIFEWHVRFPPKPGRIHFRLVNDDRSARIAYIGRKLGV